MAKPVNISVAGAGQIGKRHIDAVRMAAADVSLHSIVDPAETARVYAKSLGIAWHHSLSSMFANGKPDGVIIATPNQMHVEHGLACIGQGIPVLMEKPVATDVASGEMLVAEAAKANVPVLTGHHRRHNPLIQRAKAEIDGGSIGSIVSVSATTWFFKPDDYFDTEWRRRPGAGPVFLNLIHDIDLMHFLCGPIIEVHAMESNAVRGNAVEETAIILLRFKNGALGTINVSDTIVAPWSWEMTARENPAFPPTAEPCYLIGGTHGSLELPGLRLWRNANKRSWLEPIGATQLPFGFDDPLTLQIRQFAAVIRGKEKPLVSGHDGVEALRVIEAVKRSAATGQTIRLG